MASVDPGLLKYVVKAAAAHGADPVALLATALQESGGRRGAVGDQGTSFGFYQFHKGGALPRQYYSNPFPYADSYDVVDNRARLFAQGGVHGGRGAAAIQRPADRAGYATAVDAKLAQARALLAGRTGAKTPTARMTKTNSVPGAPPGTSPVMPPGLAQLQQAALARQQRLQSIIDQNSQLAGIPSVSVPLRPIPSQGAALSPRSGTVSDAPSAPQPGGVRVSGGGYPLAQPGKLIGTPYAGTHSLGNWESDNAVDLATPVGTPIVAMFDGTIGSQFGSLGSGGRFAGLRLHLQGADNEAYYAHLSKFAPGIQPGSIVKRGQIIGYSGSANGVAHLHLGVRNGDPRSYL